MVTFNISKSLTLGESEAPGVSRNFNQSCGSTCVRLACLPRYHAELSQPRVMFAVGLTSSPSPRCPPSSSPALLVDHAAPSSPPAPPRGTHRHALPHRRAAASPALLADPAACSSSRPVPPRGNPLAHSSSPTTPWWLLPLGYGSAGGGRTAARRCHAARWGQR
ncbi:hypothetical protein PVAP13_2KG277666 [Panicum virgatum]|uniref:Uncharacterized protein n=1 Tax=Panicum virgatum TaxID=38727 RepID=A0A8T0W959_PANVG|nr:hypothetical protein PVAP13_2KG277666 [Panicum virgatum]